MLSLRTLTLATVSATLVAAPATLVVAQDAPETGQTQVESQATDFDDAQIDAFADAAIELGKIQENYAQDFQDASDDEERQELLKQVDAEMRETIEQNDDITVSDYLEINRAASNDEELGQKIAQRIQEIQSESAG